MSHRFADLMFTPHVKQVQTEQGSRTSYSRFETGGEVGKDRLGPSEVAFIAGRDSFYMASVSETGWPYVQHRGGPPGFLKVLDDQTLGFADYRGNRQYISVGNLITDDRVSLFMMDYRHQKRLKLLGHARLIDLTEAPDLMARLHGPHDPKAERGIVITVEGYDWNCPQHITPRYTEAELAEVLRPARDRMQALETENATLRARLNVEQ